MEDMSHKGPLVGVLLDTIQREYERIERSKAEIEKCRDELAELGWVGPASPDGLRRDKSGCGATS